MPLNYNLEKIENWKELIDENEYLKEPYSSIILSTMVVGFRTISEKNWKKFYNRLHMIEKIKGACTHIEENGKPKLYYITEEDVKRMIGLETNVSNKTKAVFLKDLFKYEEL